MSEIIAKSKYINSAPRKLRAVAALVKGKPAVESLTTLRFTPKKAAKMLAKTLKTAIYNAVNNFNLSKNTLTIKNITVDQGPTLRRFIAMARGSGNEYRKRTSHLTVILESPEENLVSVKSEPKTDVTPSNKKASSKKTPAKKAGKIQKPVKPASAKTEIKVRARRSTSK